MEEHNVILGDFNAKSETTEAEPIEFEAQSGLIITLQSGRRM